jgi:hypothetical protein
MNMEKEKLEERSLYQIRIKGTFIPIAHNWMNGVKVINNEDNETLLAIQIQDQSALRGIMNQLWNLNFTVLSIERIE